MAAAVVGQIERAGEDGALAGEMHDHLSMGAFVDRLVECDGRRRALRGGRVVEGLPAPAQGEHDSRQQETGPEDRPEVVSHVTDPAHRPTAPPAQHRRTTEP